MDEALAEQQREAYKVPGVDDETDVNPMKKRKAAEVENVSKSDSFVTAHSLTRVQDNAKKQRNEKPKERVNTAVYVSSLPEDVDQDELYDVFSRYGVIAEGIDDNLPRIKMYHSENGDFNGDALISEFSKLHHLEESADVPQFTSGQSRSSLQLTCLMTLTSGSGSPA